MPENAANQTTACSFGGPKLLLVILDTGCSDSSSLLIFSPQFSNNQLLHAGPFERTFIKILAASELYSNNNRAGNYQRVGDSCPINPLIP
jgi:hypothetical protein